MAFIPVPNVAEVALRYFTDAGQMVNTLYFEFPTEPLVSEMQTLAGEVFDWWNTFCRPLQAPQLALGEIAVTDLTFQDAPGIVFTTGLPLNGSLAGGLILPGNVTLSITFQTLLRGRNNRGRNYWCGLAEGQVTGDLVNPATRTAIVDAYAQLMEITVISFGTWVVVSRYFNNAPRVNGVANEITNVKADNTVDSQRRRLSGRGA